MWLLAGVAFHVAVFDVWSLRPRPLVKAAARTIAGVLANRVHWRYGTTNVKGMA